MYPCQVSPPLHVCDQGGRDIECGVRLLRTLCGADQPTEEERCACIDGGREQYELRVGQPRYETYYIYLNGLLDELYR